MNTHRLRMLGVLVAIVVVAALGMGVNALRQPDHTAKADGPAASQPSAGDKKPVPIVLTPARSMTFEHRVVVSGSILARQYALVSARIPGTLDAVFVDEGDRVEVGRTKLFQTDALKLDKAVAIAEQNLKVAECTVREKQALLDRDLAGLDQAEKDLARYRELLAKTAIAAQVVEQQEAQFQQVSADVRHGRSLVELAQAQLEQAKLSLSMAKKDQADSLVTAPISGMVAERFREPGEMAAPGTPVVRLENLASLEVSVFLPEQYFAEVVSGKTTMKVRVGEIDLGGCPVDYKGPTVHPRLRTFEVKGLIDAPPPDVVPGCLAEVTIITQRRGGVGVPTGAIGTRGGRSVLFTVAQGKAKMLSVTTGGDTDGWREIVEGVAPGMPVISMGQFLVDDGSPVSVVREEAAP